MTFPARRAASASPASAASMLTTAAGISHGTNDAQGIIAMLLVLGGVMANFAVPLWVILTSTTAITLGTLSGGWRIVRTLGFGIYRVVHALDELTARRHPYGRQSAVCPTTQVVSTAIMGVGASERPRSVRWGTARHILATWIITMPGSARVVGIYLLTGLPTGIALGKGPVPTGKEGRNDELRGQDARCSASRISRLAHRAPIFTGASTITAPCWCARWAFVAFGNR